MIAAADDVTWGSSHTWWLERVKIGVREDFFPAGWCSLGIDT